MTQYNKRMQKKSDVEVRKITTSDDDDVQPLDQSYDMMSVGGNSMAGMSEASGNDYGNEGLDDGESE